MHKRENHVRCRCTPSRRGTLWSAVPGLAALMQLSTTSSLPLTTAWSSGYESLDLDNSSYNQARKLPANRMVSATRLVSGATTVCACWRQAVTWVVCDLTWVVCDLPPFRLNLRWCTLNARAYASLHWQPQHFGACVGNMLLFVVALGPVLCLT